jgi:hypothetical protein
MTNGPIISDSQALRILKNDLRKAALDKRAAELNNATAQRKAEILAEFCVELKKVKVDVREREYTRRAY